MSLQKTECILSESRFTLVRAACFSDTFVSIEPLDPLGTMAKKMDLSLSQTINLLSELGVRSPIGHDDYLESYAAARSLVADAED